MPEPETKIEFQEMESSKTIQNNTEIDEMCILFINNQDIKLPLLPRFPDVTACKWLDKRYNWKLFENIIFVSY